MHTKRQRQAMLTKLSMQASIFIQGIKAKSHINHGVAQVDAKQTHKL
jgi:hypothetical protein